jgi:aconitate hydratase
MVDTIITQPEGAESGRVSIAAACRGRAVGELPYAARILVENLERHRRYGVAGRVSPADVARMVRWEAHIGAALPLHISRVILPDSSGLPVLQDLAALRDAVARRGLPPERVEPMVPVDVIVDHSLQVDEAGHAGAAQANMLREFERNGERYRFLKWARGAFHTVRIFPPGSGIIHQLNLEQIASVVTLMDTPDGPVAGPDFVIGGDSHTPMINALGVLGWGVGGIEAEAAMLGQAYVFPVPDFIGVRLEGRLPPGATTTDLALLVTERLRAAGVTAAIIEYGGPGVLALPVPERATLANMAPEYGATAGFFPIDALTIAYLAQTRGPAKARLVEDYARANALFRTQDAPEPLYSRTITIGIGDAKRSVAGPRRPQDRLDLSAVAPDFRRRLFSPLAEDGFAVDAHAPAGPPGHGALAIAAITACTNTSNPSVMVAAGLLARNALAAGLTVPDWVKTSLAPGSRVVTAYLHDLGLLDPLERLGFHVVGYGCTTCGGKSGPLKPALTAAVQGGGLVVAAALSGNRNFDGRIHRQVRANYIMSPPLVVAYALAGRVDIDLDREPLLTRADGSCVMLADLWPSAEEIGAHVRRTADPLLYRRIYDAPEPNASWDALDAPGGAQYAWDPDSSYIVEPPFLALAAAAASRGIPDAITGARVLGAYGDSLTTDHISPGGEIPVDSAAGRYLLSLGIPQKSFNTYVGRRCNHAVMARATFANLRIKNRLVPAQEGGVTRLFPDGAVTDLHAAAMEYRDRGVPLIILGGRDYGTGSSRDWAAKGPVLLGVRAVIAESYERIHRANLVGMGILPLRFAAGEGWQQLGVEGSEVFDITGLQAGVMEGAPITVTTGATIFTVTADLANASERDCLLGGGILAGVMEHYTRPAQRSFATP